MAAEQRPGERLCLCGCGRSIAHMRTDTKWAAPCKEKRELDRRREDNQRRRDVRAAKPKPEKVPARIADRPSRLAMKSVRKRNIVVDHRAEPKREPRKVCPVCCDMPWARTPDRFDEARIGFEKPVVGDNGLCRGCGEAWEPEPPPDRLEPLQSSAGSLVAYGELHSTNYLAGYTSPKTKKKGVGP